MADLLEGWTALREGVGRLDVSPWGLLEVCGPDALKLLHGQTTQDILTLPPGQGRHAVFADPKGHVLADAYVFHRAGGAPGGPAALVEMTAASADRLQERLARYVPLVDCTLASHTRARRTVLVAGPGVPTPRLGISEDPGGAWLIGAPRLGRVPCVLVATGAEGAPLPAWAAAATPAPPEAVEAVRLEEGVPLYGVDVTDDNLPQEALPDDALHFGKGCYTGQETIARLHHRGQPARRLRTLVFPADAAPPARGAPVRHGGEQVGAVTSAAWSPGLRRPIALAYLHRKALEAETVDVSGVPARVRTAPAYPS